MSDFLSNLKQNIVPTKDIFNRKIDFQRENFLKGISHTRHGQKEDPTYIYFKFIFDFGENENIDPETFLAPSPLFRSYKDDDTSNYKKNGFYTDIDFFWGSKIKAMENSSQIKLFNIYEDGLAYMGAQQFLAQRSIKRKQMLEAFKKGIRFINKHAPYYFQSLSGLNTLLEAKIKNYHNPRGTYRRIGTLNIDCLESIDMRIFSLAELYRKAVYDFTYHRVMLPENLRKFRMWLVITELRNIQLTNNINDVLNPFSIPSVASGYNFLYNFNSQTGFLKDKLGLYQKSTNNENPGEKNFATYELEPYAFIYQFDQCEFDFDSTFPSYERINNSSGERVHTSFKIHVGRVKDYKIQFNLLTDIIEKDDNIRQMVLSDIWGSLNDNYNEYDYVNSAGIEKVTFSDKEDPGAYFARLASNFILNTVSDLKNYGVSVLEKKLLGNIYGFGGLDIRSMTSSAQSLYQNIKEGIPNPFRKNNPQARGYGGPTERYYPTINENTYHNISYMTNNNINEDVYPNVPGKDLGPPQRKYPKITQ